MAKRKNNVLAKLTLTLVGVAIGLATSATAWQKLREQKEMTYEARQEVRDVESRRADLLKKQSVVNTDAGKETIARDRGFQYPNEQPIEPK